MVVPLLFNPRSRLGAIYLETFNPGKSFLTSSFSSGDSFFSLIFAVGQLPLSL